MAVRGVAEAVQAVQVPAPGVPLPAVPEPGAVERLAELVARAHLGGCRDDGKGDDKRQDRGEAGGR